jgi:hypothetical protein
MSKIFGKLENGYVTNRMVFASYEDAEAIMGAGNFVEETEETGPIYIGGFWDGTTCTPPEPEEIVVEEQTAIETPTE